MTSKQGILGLLPGFKKRKGTMPEIKITYFDIRGRGEPIRLALSIADIPFEQERLTFADWPDVKGTTPYGSLPLMTIDGKVMAQSTALLQYAGKMAGLYPEDPLDALKVDEVVNAMEDLNGAFYRYIGSDPEKQKEQADKLSNEDIPRYLGGIEKRLEGFGCGKYVLGDTFTIADLMIVNAVNNVRCGQFAMLSTDCAEKYTNVMKIYHSTMEHPKVAAWYKTNSVKTM